MKTAEQERLQAVSSPCEEKPEAPSRLKTIAIALLILLAGVVGAFTLIALRSSPPRTAATQVATLVTVAPLNPIAKPVVLSGYGTVVAARMLEVRAQVSGHIVETHPQFEQGGRIPAGSSLLQIDPRDYEIAVKSQEAALATAEFELALEQGNQIVAQREWKLLKKNLGTTRVSEDLALRKPHLKAREAAAAAAQSMLERAELDLERTRLVSPFDAVVVNEQVETGQFVNPQTSLGSLAATNEFHVQVRLPSWSLQWLKEDSSSVGVTVRGMNTNAGSSNDRKGSFVRLLGNVDTSGRMAQALVRVPNPLDPPPGIRPLLLGSYVQVLFEGKTVNDVLPVPRASLREGNEIWVMTMNNTLAKRPVSPVFSDGEFSYVRGKLKEGDLLITSPVAGALEGMKLRTIESLEDEKPTSENE